MNNTYDDYELEPLEDEWYELRFTQIGGDEKAVLEIKRESIIHLIKELVDALG